MTPAIVIAIVFALAAGGLVQAQDTPILPKTGDRVTLGFTVPPKDGEFRKEPTLGGIGCVNVGSRPAAADGYGHCLKLGAAKLGLEFHQLQAYLAKDKRIPESYIVNAQVMNVSSDGMRTALIAISGTESGGQLRLHSYIVATVLSNGQVDSLQLTGTANEATEALHFSGIKLGSPRKWVVDVLGFPSSVEDVPKIKGTLWSYAPFPFSFELVNGIVYSIRIHRLGTEDQRKRFVPLKAVPE